VKKRERILLIIVLISGALGLFYRFYLADALEASASGGTLSVEQRVFRDNVKMLKDKAFIEGNYRRFDIGLPERVNNQKPDKTFVNELDKMLKQQLGIPAPKIGIPKNNWIENVDDYYFIDVNVDVDGAPEEMVTLLQNMEKHGLLIKDFTLTKTREGAHLKVGVSRLVKHDDESRRKVKKKPSRSGAGAGTGAL
jgi:hypothetical protein